MKNLQQTLNKIVVSFITLCLVLISTPSVFGWDYIHDYYEFDANAQIWTTTNGFSWSLGNNCSNTSSGALDAFGTAYTETSTKVGTSRRIDYPIAVSLDYKAAASGTLTIEYKVGSGGTWQSLSSVGVAFNQSCTHYNAPVFYEPYGADIYIKISSSVEIAIDNIQVIQVKINELFKSDDCWGVPIAPSTFYIGLAQWYWMKVRAFGPADYSWSLTSGSATLFASNSYQAYVYEPTTTVPIGVSVRIALTTYCYYEYITRTITVDDTYWAGTPSDPWWLHICEGGVDKIETYNDALQKVCFGNATLGYCVPKTTPEIVESFNVEIYPNPSNGEFVLDIANADNETNVEVYNTSGVLVFNGSYTNATREMLDLSNLSVGVYFVRVYSGNEMFTDKLIVK